MKSTQRKLPHYQAGIVIDKLVFSCTSTAPKGKALKDLLLSQQEIPGYEFKPEKAPKSLYKDNYSIWYMGAKFANIGVRHLKKQSYDEYKLTVDNTLYYYVNGASLPNIAILLAHLELTFNKIIQLDVAIDHYNTNPQEVFWKQLKNPINKVKFKKKLYGIDQYIPDLLTIFSGTRQNGNLIKTTYLQQKDGTNMKQLVLYDKLQEIMDVSHKEYILNYHFMRESEITELNRAEIRTSSKFVMQYEEIKGFKIDLEFLWDSACLFDYFVFHLNRLIQVTDKKGNINTFICPPYIEHKEKEGRKKVITAIEF